MLDKAQSPQPRSRGSHTPTSPFEAIEVLLARTQVVEPERVALHRSLGRVPVDVGSMVTDRPSPPLDVSAMDGFALRHDDLALGRLPIAAEVRIGQPPPAIPPTAALRIVTGGAIPGGADMILKREDVVEADGAISWTAEVAERARRGDHIRRAGENAAPNAPLLAAGRPLDAAAIGALAATGITSVAVTRQVRLAILTTGDEIVPSHELAPHPWQVRDSNGPALAALFARAPWIASIERRHVIDDEAEMERRIRAAIDGADAILLTGGVSMGHRDFVPSCLERAGAEILFHTVPQRPGKPVLGAITERGQPILALPGNPVSVLATARRMAWPVLASRGGGPSFAAQPDALVTLTNADARTLRLWWHRPVREAAAGSAELVDLRGSGDLVAAGQSHGFVELPPDASGPGPWPLFRWSPRT